MTFCWLPPLSVVMSAFWPLVLTAIASIQSCDELALRPPPQQAEAAEPVEHGESQVLGDAELADDGLAAAVGRDDRDVEGRRLAHRDPALARELHIARHAGQRARQRVRQLVPAGARQARYPQHLARAQLQVDAGQEAAAQVARAQHDLPVGGHCRARPGTQHRRPSRP